MYLDASDFGAVISHVWELFTYKFTIYGVSLSFFDVICWCSVVTAVGCFLFSFFADS